MLSHSYVLYTLVATFGLTTANPTQSSGVGARNLFQIEPDVMKRALYDVSNIKDNNRKKFLQDAQKEAVDIAGIALKHMNDDPYKDLIDHWFGTAKNIKADIKGVLENFVADNKNSEGASVLGQVRVHNDDYWAMTPKFCDRTQNGRTGTAYFKPKDRKPGMHFCDKFYQRKSKADYLANNCALISSHIDTDTTTRMYRGANVLHEFMHFSEVGKKQTKEQIGDDTYGAYNCFHHKDTKKDGKAVNAALNADTYVYFTMHIWLSINCKKTFSFPRGPQDN